MKCFLFVACLLLLECISSTVESAHQLCLVPNCRLCSSANYCGLCLNNYILQIDIQTSQPFCQPVSCNVPDCSTCYQDNICDVCGTGYHLTQDGICSQGYLINECPQMCSVCEGSVCLLCSFGYSLEEGKCLSVYEDSIVGCQKYFSQNSCQLCQEGYIVRSEGSCQKIEEQNMKIKSLFSSSLQMVTNMTCNILNCFSCFSPNYCGQCLNNQTSSQNGQTCLNCSVANCLLCTGNNVCTYCSPGYHTNIYSSLCQLCNIPGCSSCSTPNFCNQCSQFYILNNTGTCQLCLYPCTSCSAMSSSYCLTCSWPYNGFTINGVCYTCSIPNCQTCQYNGTYCQECMPNYVLNFGTCILQCGVFCENCGSSSCQTCAKGYVQSPYNPTQCIMCSASNCFSCIPTQLTFCTQCNSGYYNNNGTCITCQANCMICDQLQCFQYLNSLVQITTTVQDFITGVNYQSTCDPGCGVCTNNPIYCEQCLPGFSLNTQTRICVPCTYPCLQCNPATPSLCLGCYNNAFLNGSTCLSCNPSSNCFTCNPNNLSQCLSCPAGYLWNNITFDCTASCPSFCLICIQSNICSLCLSGYSKNANGQCLPCASNCRECLDNNQGACQQCGVGFYIGIEGIFQLCPPYCQQCFYQGCVTCIQGYYVSQNSTCIPVCFLPCATCVIGQPNMCTSCLLGYTYNSSNNSCEPQPINCQIGCYYCPFGYIPDYPDFNQCIQCTSSSNCARCNPNNVTQCLTCINSNYLSPTTSTCVSCPSGCATCTSNSSCTLCIAGYYLPYSPISVPLLCLHCLPPCVNCYQYANLCLSCIDGYSLNGWNCQSNFNFIFSLEFAAQPYQFYENYSAILSALVVPLNNSNNIGAVTVSSINLTIFNIINFTGTISTNYTEFSTEAKSQFNALKKQFASGTIGSLNILQYVLYNSSGSPTPPIPISYSSSIKLGLILGICIPIMVIIVIIMIFFADKRFFGNNDQSTDSTNIQIKENFQMESPIN